MKPTSRRWTTTLAAAPVTLVAIAALAGCGDDTGADEPGDGSQTAVSQAPTDAETPAFCYAYGGLSDLPRSAAADEVQDDVARLADTGTPPDAGDQERAGFEALVEQVTALGDDADHAGVADVLASGDVEPLRTWAEGTCEGVYVDDFSDDDATQDETDVRALVDQVNQANADGDCQALPDLYTEGSNVKNVVADCTSGDAPEIRVIGGGVLSPYTAEAESVFKPAAEGEPYYLDVAKQDGEWRLVAY